ncbi:CBS domain-containing protein [Amaricoccus macauensis]|uniref:CBS domain-containing protein n=1 Tax=Amaricoccus macauensis TaxID=57001 RepID=UPI003C7EC19A
MSFVESYRGHLKADDEGQKSHSQSADSNLMPGKGAATVSTILEDKGHVIYSVKPESSVSDAVSLLKAHRIGAVLVLGADGGLVGILSERDVVRKMADAGGHVLTLPVSDLMTSNPVTCQSNERLIEMMHRMTEGRFRHLPVVDDGKLVGLITIGDVVKHRLLELEYEALKMKQMIVG